MAKKKTKKAKATPKENKPEGLLPQNIVAFGEHVEEDKNIYISQRVYKEIHKFTRDKTENESGGVLMGEVIEEFGKTNIVIRGFIEAKHSEGTPTTLKFTHETWEHIHKEADKKYAGYKILGWIHTHPDFGIFLSEYDKFIQENFFKEDDQIAYVVDPIQNIEGFYFWINGKIERCKGFYVFDKTGTKITVSESEPESETVQHNVSRSPVNGIVTAVLAVAVAVLAVTGYAQSNKIEKLEEQQYAIIQQQEQQYAAIQQQMNTLYQIVFGTPEQEKEEASVEGQITEPEVREPVEGSTDMGVEGAEEPDTPVGN